MWGFSSRGARLGDRRRAGRAFQAGPARVTVRGSVEHAIVQLEGEIDFTTIDDVAGFVLSLPHRIVAVDLQGLEFVDGETVLRLRLLVRQLAARGYGDPPRLTGMSRTVARVFNLVETTVVPPITGALA